MTVNFTVPVELIIMVELESIAPLLYLLVSGVAGEVTARAVPLFVFIDKLVVIKINGLFVIFLSYSALDIYLNW